MNPNKLNIANALFAGFNDQNGLMICGYEWGFSKEDEKLEAEGKLAPVNDIPCTFASKFLRYGNSANTWRYDNNVIEWFKIWQHPLNREGLGGDFEKSIVQTNWANTCNNNMGGRYKHLLEPENLENFLKHLSILRPKVILFMGSKLNDLLNHPTVLPRVEVILGKKLQNRKLVQKPTSGIAFKVYFQDFEHCKTVTFPHPSASRGLSYEYIGAFTPEMSDLLQAFKTQRGFK